MFDFEKLTVYTKAKSFNKEVSKLLKQVKIDSATKKSTAKIFFKYLVEYR